jgi:hypothetical protein
MWFKFLNQHDAGGAWVNWFRMILEGGGTSGTDRNWMWHYISTGMSVPLDVSCAPYVASFSGLSFFDCPFGIL